MRILTPLLTILIFAYLAALTFSQGDTPVPVAAGLALSLADHPMASKLTGTLATDMALAQDGQKVRVMVRLKGSSGGLDIQSANMISTAKDDVISKVEPGSISVRNRFTMINGFSADVSADAIATLIEDDSVESISVVAFPVSPTDQPHRRWSIWHRSVWPDHNR